MEDTGELRSDKWGLVWLYVDKSKEWIKSIRHDGHQTELKAIGMTINTFSPEEDPSDNIDPRIYARLCRIEDDLEELKRMARVR